MRPPFHLSPYVRPIRQRGALRFDNGMTEAMEDLSPLEERIVRALWEPLSAPFRFGRLARETPPGELRSALDALRQRLVLFDDPDTCEATFDRVLASRLPDIPFIDQIELTNVCPMRCAFRPRGVPGRMKRATGYMDIEFFSRLLRQLHPEQAAYRPLELHHLGESLMHPAGHLCDGCAWRRASFRAAMPERHPDKAVDNPLQW